jgi:hypothetical protein
MQRPPARATVRAAPLSDSVPGRRRPPLRNENLDSGTRSPPQGVALPAEGADSASTRDRRGTVVEAFSHAVAAIYRPASGGSNTRSWDTWAAAPRPERALVGFTRDDRIQGKQSARGDRCGRRVACESCAHGGSRAHCGQLRLPLLSCPPAAGRRASRARRAGLVSRRGLPLARAGRRNRETEGAGRRRERRQRALVLELPRRPPPAEGRRLVTPVHRVLWLGVRLRGLSGEWR